jgi:hypothetical protein
MINETSAAAERAEGGLAGRGPIEQDGCQGRGGLGEDHETHGIDLRPVSER